MQGIFFTGAHLAGGVTPLIVADAHEVDQLAAVFVIFGLVGFAWAAFWYAWFRDEPEQHRRSMPRNET